MRTRIFVFTYILLIPCQIQADCEPNIPGDVNGDCKVDFNDFAIVASHWLEVKPKTDQVWVSLYSDPNNYNDHPYAIVVDSSGNTYVTGLSCDGPYSYDCDYLTIKYEPNGTELWLRKYDGPGNDYDCASAITIDSCDNIYVTGSSKGSDAGFVSGEDYATIKYSPDGNELWVARYNNWGSTMDFANDIAIDSLGNIYVTGESKNIFGHFDYATIKYDPNGNELWVARYDGPANDSDSAYDIAIDNSDNVYVTGGSEGSGTDRDYATIKYSPDGNELWVKRYNGSGNYYDRADAIDVDVAGNIYVTGGSEGSGTSRDYATIKYDPNGSELWVKRYNGPVDGSDYAHAIAIDGSDNVYVTGYSNDSNTGIDYATIKYDSNGTELWVKRYNYDDDSSDLAYAIVVDNFDNVYVTGQSQRNLYFGYITNDYATIKYDPNGNQLWMSRFNGPDNVSDIANSMAVDNSGNVYVTGQINYTGSGTSGDYGTIKYTPSYICTAKIIGDFDNDCNVDFSDLAEITSHWLECNFDPPEACWE